MTTSILTTLKDQHRATWAAGDYAAVARHVDGGPPEQVLAATGAAAGQDVLDVATGSGNVALRAAALGANVTGLDLVPELLEIAGERAAAQGLAIDLVAGDAEALPFADGSFDRVLSTFGIQFAPRHQVVADELVRVCRPGGAIGLVNWTPEGLIGRMFGVMSRWAPKPPAFASPPPLWGDEEHVRTLFDAHDVELSFERGINTFAFDSVEDYMSFFEERYGPTIKTRERLVAQGAWDECQAALRALYEELNEADDGSFRAEAEYLMTIVDVPA
jgi:SAM-dependent methyltransferase